MNWFQEQYRKPPKLILHLSLVLTAWLYSGMHVLSKPALGHLPPFVFAVVRVSMGLPFMYLISRMEERVELTWKDNGQLIIIGLLGIGIGQSLVFVANTLIGAGILAMMIPLATIFTVVMSAILGLERVGILKGFGVALAVAGSISIPWITEKDFHSDRFWGVAFMFMQGIAMSAYFILLSNFLRRKPIPLYAYFRASLWGFLFMLPFGTLQSFDVKWGDVPRWVWLVELYCGIVVSSGAHVVLSWLVRHCAAFLPALYASLQPVTTVTLATLFLGETFNVWLILCMLCILGGLFLVIIVQAKEEQQARLVTPGDTPHGNDDAGDREPLLPVQRSMSSS